MMHKGIDMDVFGIPSTIHRKKQAEEIVMQRYKKFLYLDELDKLSKGGDRESFLRNIKFTRDINKLPYSKDKEVMEVENYFWATQYLPIIEKWKEGLNLPE